MVASDAAFSRGDIMRRLRELEKQVERLQTARRLEAASIGAGGLRLIGGLLRIQDTDGDDMFRAGGDPGELFLRQDLLADVTRAIMGAAITGGRTNGVAIITASSWADPNTGDAGPVLSGVNVGESGRCIVHMSAGLSQLTLNDGSVGEVQMSFKVTGVTSRSAGSTGTLSLGRGQSGTGGNDIPSGFLGATALLEDLNEGVHTIRAQYQLTGAVTSATVTFPTLIATPY